MLWYFYIRSCYAIRLKNQSTVHSQQSTKVCKKAAQPAEHYVPTTYLLHFHIFHFHAPYRIAKNNVILSLFLPTQPFLHFKKNLSKTTMQYTQFLLAMYVCGMHSRHVSPLQRLYVKYFFSRQIATRIIQILKTLNLI